MQVCGRFFEDIFEMGSPDNTGILTESAYAQSEGAYE